MLDEKDLALVHALQEAPRASWAVLAAELGTDARTVARRYARLRDGGLLRVMATAGPRLLDQVLFAHLRLRTAPGTALHVAEQLGQWPQATTIRLTDGSYDVHVILLGVDHGQLVRAAHEKLADLPDVREAEINTVLRAGDVGRAARLDSLSPRQVSQLRTQRSGETKRRTNTRLSVDDLDLLQLLLRDGRIEVADLAARLGREPSVMSRRLARLRADGFLDVIALTPDSAWSSPVRALLWCTVGPQDVEPLLGRVAGLPWVGLLTLTTGRANALVVANLRSAAHLTSVEEQLAQMCPSVQMRETQLSPRAVKLHMRLVTDGDRLSDEVSDPFVTLRQALVTG